MNALALKGWLPAWLAMWSPNLAGGIISAALLGRTVRN
jgi:lipopolysaccharide export LptBFGC system permease protein LptF